MSSSQPYPAHHYQVPQTYNTYQSNHVPLQQAPDTYHPPASNQYESSTIHEAGRSHRQSGTYHITDERKGARVRHRPHGAYHNQSYKRQHSIRAHFIAAIGEFVGTVMFLWLSLAGTQRTALQTDPTLSLLADFYICLVFGLSLAVCAWAFYRVSGGLFNPAVTVGMLALGSLTFTRALFIFPAQILGGMTAAALVSCMFPGPIAATNTVLSDGTSIAQGLFIEAFMTALLVFTILMLAGEDNYAKPVAPVGIGLALFAAMLAGVTYTGGSLNPARSFGPAVASRSFVGYHYIYWIGPIFGALVAAGYVRYLKWIQYQDAQPDQDVPPDEKRSASRHSNRSSQHHHPRS